MRTTKLTLRLVGPALTCVGLSTAGVPAFAVDYWLRAGVTTVNVNGTDVPMWGYAKCNVDGVSGFNSCDPIAVPGPQLSVPQADTTLTVRLRNSLAVPTSLVIHGLVKAMAPTFDTDAQGRRRVRSFDKEAAASINAVDGEAEYSWSGVKPGTYLYQSGTQPQVQVQMGLYGAATKNFRDPDPSATPGGGQAYEGAAYAYDNHALLLYSEIDPVLHAAVAVGTYGPCPTATPDCGNTTSTIDYAPRYFLINGKVYPAPDLLPIAPSGSPGTTLLRLLNAGLTTHVPMVLGRYWDVIAEDGKPYTYVDASGAKPHRRSQYTALLPAAKTLDVLVPNQPGAGRYAVMDRRLSLSNNGASGPGGMMAFVLPGPGTGGGGVGGAPGSGTGTNQPPVAVDDPASAVSATYETVAGVALNIGAPGVLVNDSDPNLSQAITAVTATDAPTATGAGGKYTLNANGSFTLTPSASVGSYSFSYRAKDTHGALSNFATVTVNVVEPKPPAISSTLLDTFNITDGPLSSSWAYTSDGISSVRVTGNQAAAAGSGGLAIWQAVDFGETQYAAFTSATSLAGASLILKATGGTLPSQPNGYIEVRHRGVDIQLFTVGSIGSGGYTETLQATFPTSASGTLSAKVDFKGLVTIFQSGSYVGGFQLPSWTAPGRIGLKLGIGAAVDDFVGGTL